MGDKFDVNFAFSTFYKTPPFSSNYSDYIIVVII